MGMLDNRRWTRGREKPDRSRRVRAAVWAERLRTGVGALRLGSRRLPPWGLLALRMGGYVLLGAILLNALLYSHSVSKQAVNDAVTRFGKLMQAPLAIALLLVIALAVNEFLRATVLRRNSWSFDPGTGLGLGDYGAEQSRSGSRRRRSRRR